MYLSLTKSRGKVGGPGWGELWGVLEVTQNTHSGPSPLRYLLCKERRSNLTQTEHLAKQADMCCSRYKQRNYQIIRQSLSPRTIRGPVLQKYPNLQLSCTSFSTCYTQTQTSHSTEEQQWTNLLLFSFPMLENKTVFKLVSLTKGWERERSLVQSVSPNALVSTRHSPATWAWALTVVCKICPWIQVCISIISHKLWVWDMCLILV